ncbi:AEC family transporter [candidate division KSB1 bacterium]
MVGIFLSVVLPVFLVIAIGFLLGRVKVIHRESLSSLCLHVLTPSLIFHSLTTQTLTGPVAVGVVLFSIAHFAAMTLLVLLVLKIAPLAAEMRRPVLLSSILLNAGNYGLPVVLFAFGELGLSVGILFFIAINILTSTVGVYVAAGKDSTAVGALKSTLKIPWFYVIIAAIVVRVGGFSLPIWLAKSVELTAQAAIPVALLLLGIQLSRTPLRGYLPVASLVSSFRLLVAPALGLGLAYLLSLPAEVAPILVVQCSMPTAVFAVILSIEFDVRPEIVSSAILISTALSVPSLTALIWLVT